MLFDLLLLDMAWETWSTGFPIRTAVVGGVALYFALSLYVISKGGRVGGRGWLMDPLVPAILFVGCLVGCTFSSTGFVQGAVALRQPTTLLMTGTTGTLIVLACIRLVAPGGAKSWWLRIALVALCGYALAGFVLGARASVAFKTLLDQPGFPLLLPRWLQATWVGAWVVLPLATARELGAMIARLKVAPYLAWMMLFGAGWALMLYTAG